MKKLLLFFLVGVAILCTNAYAQENPYAITTKVIKNEQTIKLLQKQQADLYLKLEDLLVKYGEIKGQLDDLKHRIDLLNNQLNQLLLKKPLTTNQPSVEIPENQTPPSMPLPPNKPAVNKQPAANLKPTLPKPQLQPQQKQQLKPDKVAFYNALKLFKQKQYDKAIEAFKSFQQKFKDSKLIGDAYFYLGECYFAKKQYDRAIINYDYLVNTYPHNKWVKTALFKEGVSFIKMGDKIDGRYLLKKVIQQYPSSTEAQKAKKILGG